MGWPILVSIVPGLLILRHIRQAWSPEAPRGLLWSHLFAGASIAMLALVLELALKEPLLQILPISFAVFGTAFVVAALVEEGVKAVGIKAAADRARDRHLTVPNIMGVALTVSLGFGIAETCLYALAYPHKAIAVALIRYCSAIPLHYLNGSLIAVAYIERRLAIRNEVAWMFLVVVVAHGFYDYVIMINDEESGLAVMVLGALWAYSRWQIRRMQAAQVIVAP